MEQYSYKRLDACLIGESDEYPDEILQIPHRFCVVFGVEKDRLVVGAAVQESFFSGLQIHRIDQNKRRIVSLDKAEEMREEIRATTKRIIIEAERGLTTLSSGERQEIVSRKRADIKSRILKNCERISDEESELAFEKRLKEICRLKTQYYTTGTQDERSELHHNYLRVRKIVEQAKESESRALDFLREERIMRLRSIIEGKDWKL